MTFSPSLCPTLPVYLCLCLCVVLCVDLLCVDLLCVDLLCVDLLCVYGWPLFIFFSFFLMCGCRVTGVDFRATEGAGV